MENTSLFLVTTVRPHCVTRLWNTGQDEKKPAFCGQPTLTRTKIDIWLFFKQSVAQYSEGVKLHR